MKKYQARAALAFALATVFLTGTLAGCTLNNPFKTSVPEVVQDSVPAPVITEAEVPTPAPAESKADIVEVTPTPTPLPTIAPQVLTPTPTPEPAPMVLGEESDAETTYKLLIENSTGQNIVQLAVRVRSDGYDTAKHLSEEDPLLPNRKAMLYYDASYAIKEAKQYGDIPEYQIRFTTADGNYYVIHNLPFGEVDSIRLMLGRGYAYIVYTKMPENEEVSTRDTEREIAGVDEDLETSVVVPSQTDTGSGGSSEENGSSDNSGGYQYTGTDNSGGSGNHNDTGYEDTDNEEENTGGEEEAGGEDETGGDGNYDDDETYGEDNVVDTYDEEEVEFNENYEDEEGNVVG